ncbi:MAG TPA: hypothetical protein VHN98_07260 [Acidimicrobiales bacterium]|nr:hypothetical protein [Acidimicrobiales bacterium]
MTTRRLFALVALVAALALAGCGEKNKVGSGVDLNIKDAAGQGQGRLGERTTTTTAAAVASTEVQAKAGIGVSTAPSTTTTARPAPTTTTTQQVASIEIVINGDNATSTQFDPAGARVYVGSIVKWTNKDAQPRSVEADDGSFASGPIAPGQSWSYTAAKAGSFNYHDGTRPYAVASIEVVPR